MKRYCTNCQKEFDFHVKSMAELEKLICPECGKPIDKESRKPKNPEEIRKQVQREAGVGEAIYKGLRLSMYFYFVCGLAGVAAYFLQFYKALYILTGISVISYILRYHNFEKGYIWLPFGAIAGFYLLHTVEGVCLGLLGVLIIRHLLRRLFFKVFSWIINKCRSYSRKY